jgi:hypothetical protein
MRDVPSKRGVNHETRTYNKEVQHICILDALQVGAAYIRADKVRSAAEAIITLDQRSFGNLIPLSAAYLSHLTGMNSRSAGMVLRLLCDMGLAERKTRKRYVVPKQRLGELKRLLAELDASASVR